MVTLPTGTTLAAERKKVREAVYNELMALIFISRANTKKYGGMMKDLAVSFTFSHDEYPRTLKDAIN